MPTLRSTRRIGQSAVVLLVLAGAAGVARAEEGDEPPAETGGFVDLEVELRLSLVHPKFRIRDGTPRRRATSVRSGEVGAEELEVGGGGAFRAIVGGERLTVSAWFLDATGRGTLQQQATSGGATLPAGTRFDVVTLFRHVELEWLHRFEPWTWLRLDVGAAGAWTYAEAQLGVLGGTTLSAVYPTPRVGVTFAPFEGLELWGKLGGFGLRFPNGDTEISDVLEAWAGIRGRWGRAFAEVTFTLYQPHLERNAGEPEEDVVHMRLRGVRFGLGVRF